MKSIILAAAMTAVYAGFLTLILQVLIVREKAAVMTALFFLSLPIFILIHLKTPSNLWFLPLQLTEQERVVDLMFGLLVYFCGYFGGVLQLYNLADRGLSLRMLIDIKDAGQKGLTAEELMEGYSEGKGIKWMYEKRITDMVSRGLVSRQENNLNLSQRGYNIAYVFALLRRFLNLDT